MLKSFQAICYRSLVSIVALLALGSLPGLAQTPHPQNPKAFVPPEDPDGELDSPGGGIRGGGCYNLEAEHSMPLMAVSPIETELAQTQEARPTFRVLVGLTDADYGIFTLQDAEGFVHYRGEMIALPENGGFVAIALPPEVELAPEQTYHWFFEVLCAGHIDPNNPIAAGQIYRVSTTPADSTSPMESPHATLTLETDDVTAILSRVEFYRQSNLWYEAIDTLVTARQTYPDNDCLNQAWENWLKLAGITPEVYTMP